MLKIPQDTIFRMIIYYICIYIYILLHNTANNIEIDHDLAISLGIFPTAQVVTRVRIAAQETTEAAPSVARLGARLGAGKWQRW